MDFQKVFRREDQSILIKCPFCMEERNIDPEKVPSKHKFKVKCKCGSVYGIQLEGRTKFRKEVNFAGIILRPDQSDKWGKMLNESLETKIKKITCQIRDISMGGIGIKVLDSTEVIGEIETGDILMVKFTLDNSAETEMETMVTVKVVRGDYLGCEFSEADKKKSKLKFYFL
ncbi:PilZ domain-containing protein [Thermodesulfobacteriota bacterium]